MNRRFTRLFLTILLGFFGLGATNLIAQNCDVPTISLGLNPLKSK